MLEQFTREIFLLQGFLLFTCLVGIKERCQKIKKKIQILIPMTEIVSVSDTSSASNTANSDT
jgi:hypothetical protein